MTFIIVVLVVLVLLALAYFRFKFDMKYAMPVIKESSSLSYIYVLGVIVIAAAFVSYLLGLRKITFILLLGLIPFVLYLNFKTYFGAWSRFFKGRQDKE